MKHRMPAEYANSDRRSFVILPNDAPVDTTGQTIAADADGILDADAALDLVPAEPVRTVGSGVGLGKAHGGGGRGGGGQGGGGQGGGGRGLAGKASRGAAVMMVGQIVRVALQTVGLIILARLLTPNDFGLAASVTAIIGVGEIFRDFGLSLAAVQARSVSRAERDNLFWTNTATGAVLTLLCIALSGLIADLYDEPRLKTVAMVLSLTFVLNGATAQYRSSLQRNLKFLMVTLSDILGLLGGVIVGVVLAVAGYGYWAIAWQSIAQCAATLLFVVVVSRWLPGRYDRSTSIRHFLAFGFNILMAQVIGYAARNVDSVTIGIRFGPTPLGLYNRAFQLLTLPLNQLNAPSTRVATPVLSRLQDQPKRYADFLITGQTVLLHAVLAVLATMAALAEPGIRLLLGPQWIASISLFQILAIAGTFQTAGYVTYWVFLSKGLTRTSLHQSLVSRPIAIACVLVGSLWGVEGVAWGYTAGTAFNWPFSLWWISRVSDAPVRRLWWNGVRCVGSYGIAGAGAFGVSWLLRHDGDLVRLAAGVVGLFVVLALEALVWPRFRQDLRLIRRAGSQMR